MYKTRGILNKNTETITKVQEPIVSYEQILLMQISKCGSAPHVEFPLCVDNLISMLPGELATKVNIFYREIINTIQRHLEQLKIECCKEYINEYGFCTCNIHDTIRIARKLITDILEEQPDLIKFNHVIDSVIVRILKHDPRIQSTAMSELKFAIATQILLESGIVAPKSGHIYVGRVED